MRHQSDKTMYSKKLSYLEIPSFDDSRHVSNPVHMSFLIMEIYSKPLRIDGFKAYSNRFFHLEGRKFRGFIANDHH